MNIETTILLYERINITNQLCFTAQLHENFHRSNRTPTNQPKIAIVQVISRGFMTIKRYSRDF